MGRTLGVSLALWVAGGFGAAAVAGGIANLDLSGLQPELAAAVPVVAVDPVDSATVAVTWRTMAPLARPDTAMAGNWSCKLSLSHDGGRDFTTTTLDWGVPTFSHCNAPYAVFSATGRLYVGASLAAPLPGPPPAPNGPRRPMPVPKGATVIAQVGPGGELSPTMKVLASDTLDRFAPDPAMPESAKRSPWDGARGVLDLSTGAIYVSGAYPAPLGGREYSQRFFAASADGGRTFGPIRAFADSAWPERWDGDLAAAKGELALSYIAAATPDPKLACPCAVVAISHDGGATLKRSLVAAAGMLDIDTVVHAPEIAADPAHAGRFAVVVIGAGKNGVSVYLSQDDGASWRSLPAPSPADVTTVSRPAVAFAPDGTLALAWRGYHADGGYDVYLAVAGVNGLGAPVKVSSAESHLPAALAKTYAGHGDFHTTLALDVQAAHVAWSDARDGEEPHVESARVPLTDLSR